MRTPGLMTVFAHPDDESYGTAGVLARYAAAGIRTTVVCATRGEAGLISDPSLATPANLADVRQRELECVALTLGISHVYFLGYQDGAVDAADLSLASAKIARIIREETPDVLITFGPEGVYHHPDHQAVHRFAVEAVRMAGDPHQEPDLPTWNVAKLYYVAPPRCRFRRLPQILAAAGYPTSAESVTMNADDFGVPDEAITTVVDVRPFIEVKRAALLCHRTQVFPDSPWRLLPIDLLRQHFGEEHFTLAFSTVSSLELETDDLFLGLR